MICWWRHSEDKSNGKDRAFLRREGIGGGSPPLEPAYWSVADCLRDWLRDSLRQVGFFWDNVRDIELMSFFSRLVSGLESICHIFSPKDTQIRIPEPLACWTNYSLTVYLVAEVFCFLFPLYERVFLLLSSASSFLVVSALKGCTNVLGGDCSG